MSGPKSILEARLPWAAPFYNYDFQHDLPPGEPEARGLSPDEITQMERQGCSSSDWSVVRVHPDYDPGTVSGTRLDGHCYLGEFCADQRQGIFNSCLSDCAIGSGSSLLGVARLDGYVLGGDVRILGCGPVESGGDGLADICRTVFRPGNESGGREIPLLPGLPGTDAASALHDRSLRQELAARAEDLAAALERLPGIIAAGSRIRGCLRITHALVGPGSVVEAALSIDRAILDSAPDSPVTIGPGAVLDRALLCPGSVADTQAVVRSSFLDEGVRVENHANVKDSWIGCGSVVGGGEVTSSFMGPCTAMHHQSLLIAALWPEGRGNVGYGANIGSNHTGRAPDQEMLIGEGCFFGLSSSVKYPADFSAAPGTVVATGTVVPPGRILFPYSLVLPGSGNSALIKPGWVWSSSAYTLARNRYKHIRRSGKPAPLITQEALYHVVRALEALLDGESGGMEGGCILEGADIHRAITAYRGILRHAAAEHAPSGTVGKDLCELARLDPAVLCDREGLRALRKETAVAFLDACRKSRERDHERGMRIQPETYPDTHRPPEEDPVLRALEEEADAL